MIPQSAYEEVELKKAPAQSQKAASVLAGGALAALAGQMIGPGFNLIWRRTLARHLGTSEFGVWTLAHSIVTVVQTLLAFGLSSSAARSVAVHLGDTDSRRDDSSIPASYFGFAIAFGLLGALVVAVFANPVAQMYRIDELRGAIILLSLMIPFGCVTGVAVGVANGHFDPIAGPLLIDFTLNVTRALTVFGAAALGLSVMKGAAAILFASIITAIVAIFYMAKRFPFSLTISCFSASIGGFLAFVFSLIGIHACEAVFDRADTLLLGYIVGAGAVSQYEVASIIAQFSVLPYIAVVALFLPHASTLIATAQTAEVARSYLLTIRWSLLAGLAVSTTLYGCGEQVLGLVFARPFAGAANVMRILIVGNLLLTSLGPVTILLFAAGRTRTVLFANALGGVGNIALNVIFISLWATIGAAIATFIAGLAVNCYLITTAPEYIRVSRLLKTAGGVWLPFLLGGGIARFLSSWMLPGWLAFSAATAILTPFVFFITRVPEDLELLKSIAHVRSLFTQVRNEAARAD